VLNGLDAVFEPRRVALVGASDRPGRMGDLFRRNLASFPGEVVPVTASAATVAGRTAYPTLAAVDGDIDLAVVVVPAPAAPGVIRDAAAKGVPAAIVIAGGFAESGPDGARLQEELVAAARTGGVRIVGPNCFGVQNCDLPLNASMASGAPPGGGGITLVTQSGAYGMAIHTLGLDEQTRFAKVYAAGNKADIGDAELVRYLGADPASRTLCFFVESLPDGRAFYEAARAVTRTKPVIVAKTGRSAAGVRAARSHTAALAGSERIWRAAVDQAGMILARSGLEMMDTARALDAQPVPARPRVGIVTNSGGTGVELSDLLADEGLDVPELSAGLQDELRALLPPFASPRNPVDMTPVWSRFTELYPLLVERLARSGEVDAVVPVLLQRAAVDERVAIAVRDAVARLRADGVPVPVYVCWVAPRSARTNADLLQDAGVPCFEWPERTARALGHAARYARVRVRTGSPRVLADRNPRTVTLPDGLLEPDVGADLLRAAGIPVVESVTCASTAAAVAAADRLGYPVVAKVIHPSLLHKSDASGVSLGLDDSAAVAVAADRLLCLASGARLIVQPQLTGVEVVVGGLRDPHFGPVVMVGVGGILVEVVGDVAFGLAPLGPDEARRLIAGLRGYAALRGARGADEVDLASLSAVVCAVGDLLCAAPEIAELDLNPLFARADGCIAVDWRILAANPPSGREPGAADSPHQSAETPTAAPYRAK
jgi:acetate---CoA ligase (ADP-forming)